MVKVVKGLKEAKKAISDIRFKQKELINDKSFANKVNNILSEVAQHGDKALIKYTKEYDHVELQNICISDELLKKSWENLPPEVKAAAEKDPKIKKQLKKIEKDSEELEKALDKAIKMDF